MSVPPQTNEALNIQVIPQYDTISLELDDRINLRFTPSNPFITPDVYFTETGEFLRDFTVVRILDSDSECCIHVDIVPTGFTLIHLIHLQHHINHAVTQLHGICTLQESELNSLCQ